MRKNRVSLNELRRLVKETISETHKKNKKINETRNEKRRNQLLDSVITDTLRMIKLFEGAEEDMNDVTAGDQPEGDQPAPVGDHPYQNFVEEVLKGNYGTFETNKSDIEDFIKGQDEQGRPYWELILKGDKSADAGKIKWSEYTTTAGSLKPSQNQVFLNQSISGYLTREIPHGPTLEQILGTESYVDPGIFATSVDGYIIDGHHRCSAINGLNSALSVTVTGMDCNIKVALQVLNMILGALTKKLGNDGEKEAYRASGADGDIWSTKPTKESVEEILTGILTSGKFSVKGETFDCRSDFFVQGDVDQGWVNFLNKAKAAGWNGSVSAAEANEETGEAAQEGQEGIDSNVEINKSNVDQYRDLFCNGVAINYSKWKKPSGMPPRHEMPQIEDPGSGGEQSSGLSSKTKFFHKTSPNLEDGLPAGEYDLDGSAVNETIDLKRWSRLAGLLKD